MKNRQTHTHTHTHAHTHTHTYTHANIHTHTHTTHIHTHTYTHTHHTHTHFLVCSLLLAGKWKWRGYKGGCLHRVVLWILLLPPLLAVPLYVVMWLKKLQPHFSHSGQEWSVVIEPWAAAFHILLPWSSSPLSHTLQISDGTYRCVCFVDELKRYI